MKKRKFIVTILSIISVMWVMHTLTKNFVVDPSFHGFLSRKDERLSNLMLWVLMIRVHIILAIIALLTGPLGIVKRLRLKSLTFHRRNGRIYILSIVLNFFPGLYVSFFATGGWPNTIGFITLNTLWIITTIFGYIFIKRKDVLRHSQWITRSFFLSFANMFLYIIVAIIHKGLDLSYGFSYTIAVWLCWIFNLAIAEILIRKELLFDIQ